jgi:transcription initiation factor TFIIIB Brf1 subunit/transcription initiation factor TFIIB
MRCKECGGEAVTENGEYVCATCGLVLGEVIVGTSRFVQDTNLEHHERITSLTGNILRSQGNRAQVKTYYEKRDDSLYSHIKRFDAPEHVKKTALLLTSKYFRLGARVPSSDTEHFVREVLYISYRLCGMVPPEDLADIKSVTRTAKKLKEVGIRVRVSLRPDAPELIVRVADALKRPDVIELAKELYSGIGRTSTLPKNIACACVYRALLVKGGNPTYSGVAKTVNANPNSVGKTYRELFPQELDVETGWMGISASGFLSSALFSLRLARTHIQSPPSAGG